MVGEVALADSEQSGYVGLQLVVYPQAAHGVVDGRVNHHRVLVGVLVGNFLVHVEKVTVTLCNNILAQAVDSLGEVEEYGQAGVVHAKAFVATLLGCTRSHVARHKVAERWIAALEVIVAVFFGNVFSFDFAFLQFLGVFKFLGNPNTSVITQRLRHKREL